MCMKMSLNSNNHRLVCGQRLDADVAETGLAHPTPAVGAGKVETPCAHEKPVEAGKQADRVNPPFVVDQPFIYNEGAARWQRIMRFLQQHFFGCEVPIVQHAPKHE